MGRAAGAVREPELCARWFVVPVVDGQGQITQSALTAARSRGRIDCITSVNEDRCGIQNAAKEPGPCLSHLVHPAATLAMRYKFVWPVMNCAARFELLSQDYQSI